MTPPSLQLQSRRNFPVNILALFGCLAGLALSTFSQEKRPIELEDLFRAKRVSDPQISPDGKWVAYVVAEVDKAENRQNSDLWLVAAAGGEARQLTRSPKHDRHPRWSPDGKWIAFESNRGGAFQIYLISPDGGEAKQFTSISTEANQAIWVICHGFVACR